jgi:hypothetical protein
MSLSPYDKTHIYVAGPMSIGDHWTNIGAGLAMAEAVLSHGMVPFVPHLSALWQMAHPHTWEQWLDYDEMWLLRCDALIRIPGESKGADREEAFCAQHGIPVFHTLEALVEWNGSQVRPA